LGGTIITCVSDEDDFAASVYAYLYSELEKQKQFDEGKNMLVTPELIRLADDNNNEIQIDESALVPNKMIKWILESYLKSNPSRFKDYGVIEFGETFTIGRILHPSQMEMLTCEICGFFTPYSGELQTHRMTHIGI
jgi:hypothetical protein